MGAMFVNLLIAGLVEAAFRRMRWVRYFDVERPTEFAAVVTSDVSHG